MLREDALRQQETILLLKREISKCEMEQKNLLHTYEQHRILRDQSEMLQIKIAEGKKIMVNCQQHLDLVQQKQQAYMQHYRSKIEQRRKKLIGSTWSHYQVKNKVYYGVTITKIEEQGITLSHKNGISRIPLERLYDEQKKDLGLSLEKALLAMKSEQDREFRFYSSIEKDLLRQSIKDKSQPPAIAFPVSTIAQSASIHPGGFKSLLRETVQTKEFRVRNEGRARYYYVIPHCYNVPFDNRCQPIIRTPYRYQR